MQAFLRYINQAKAKFDQHHVVIKLANQEQDYVAFIRHAIELLQQEEDGAMRQAYLKVLAETRQQLDASVDILLEVRLAKTQIKQLKKQFADLQRLVRFHIQISLDTPERIIRHVNLCKSEKEFRKLENGFDVLGVHIPGFAERYKLVSQGSINEPFTQQLEKKRNYLARKKTADVVSGYLANFLGIVGIGLVTSVAFLALLPVMPLAVYVPLLVFLTLTGGYVEAKVFQSDIRKFCRNLFRGFFKKIDDRIVNREIRKDAEQHQAELRTWVDVPLNRYSVSAEKRAEIIKRNQFTSYLKKALVFLAAPLGVLSSVGFAAVFYIEAMEAVAALGLSGVALMVAPWAVLMMAVPLGIIYGMVMYNEIYKAIKDNVFRQIKNHVVNLFKYTGPANDSRAFAKHIVSCALKALFIAFVCFISVIATVASAGTFLSNSVAFFKSALLLQDKLAKIGGVVIGIALSAVNFVFSSEKSLNTVNHLIKLKWNKLGSYLHKIVASPKKLFKSTVAIISLLIHVVTMGALTSQGAEAFVFKSILGPKEWLNRLVAGLTEVFEESFVDFAEVAKDAVGHHHHDGGGCDHEHGDLYELGKSFVQFSKRFFMAVTNFFSGKQTQNEYKRVGESTTARLQKGLKVEEVSDDIPETKPGLVSLLDSKLVLSIPADDVSYLPATLRR